MGLADVAEIGLRNPAASNPATLGPIVTHMTNASWPNTLAQDMTGPVYRDIALRYPFITERLRVNPKPRIDYDKDGDTSDSFMSWQIAQMHPIFLPNVSAFEVAFAGDYDGTPGLDRVNNDGQIIWYDTDNLPPAHVYFNATIGQGPIQVTTPMHPHADRIFVFRHSDDTAGARWPIFVRIRFRMSDRNGRIIGPDGGVGRIFEQIFRVNS